MDQEQKDIVQRQEALLKEMGGIRVMRRGTLSGQQYPQRRARRAGHGACGPYFVWQGYVRGQRFGRRVDAQEAIVIRAEIEARQRFEALCAEYVALGECLAEYQRHVGASEEALKKGLKSRLNRARKSRG